MKPTVGRIVHYQSYGTPNGEFKPEARAAIITRVSAYSADDYVPDVCLAVMNPTGMFFDSWVQYSETPKAGHWSWPPRATVTIPKLPSMPGHNQSTCVQCQTGLPCKTFTDTPAATYPHGRSDMDIAGARLYERVTYIDSWNGTALYANTRKLDALGAFIDAIRGKN